MGHGALTLVRWWASRDEVFFGIEASGAGDEVLRTKPQPHASWACFFLMLRHLSFMSTCVRLFILKMGTFL
eukprot:CAMPEP_0182523326 /NCGR_PEP_ID=MMETSP1323-20130603/973_1 /TAXON_ID=236787 /ORGANISM="Florenciella parvula, Strain RCC1693" /LENGTH=70 /DNA_ID=CAMNT_0024731667 /DNA_START=60 /DNA_END=272 /DNA_ORIENTATION=+